MQRVKEFGISTHWWSNEASVSMLVEDMSRNKYFFQVGISHALCFIFIVTYLLTLPLTLMLEYVICGDLCVLVRITYIVCVSFWGVGVSNFQYTFSTDGFVLTCFGGSSKKLRIYCIL
jgi:hypothetical protein